MQLQDILTINKVLLQLCNVQKTTEKSIFQFHLYFQRFQLSYEMSDSVAELMAFRKLAAEVVCKSCPMKQNY